ncbi:hypothetical protein BWQ96_03191 [Gracilariopsis chorda]|uniref:Tesmin/TSO1-like CXC domain-containing protein n=1 Tax=Gracilariopsis chorda TaxID=448386 RepID=A0A2V3IY08_9FLOR|nr:hypothetical protein BWQ96_03191 [Gracilariopsis chorda]|eukprot:PXF47001.1 hypothetical protein BWQ96_03191 [Gracilariopsis chorda]
MKEVVRDSWNQPTEGPCVACGENDKRRPTKASFLSRTQLLKRSQVDTGTLPNPFVRKDPGFFLLCTSCRSPKNGWNVICDVRRYGSKSRSALQAWKVRASAREAKQRTDCYICIKLGCHFDSSIRTKANFKLFSVLLYSACVQELFCSELSRRSGLCVEDGRFLLHQIGEVRFCSLHHNQTRHANDIAATEEPTLRGALSGYCIFKGQGCSGLSAVLRPLPNLKMETLEDTEVFCEYDDAVDIYSGGSLKFEDVAGKHACGNCRYIVTRGAQGIQPSFDTVTLTDATDRCLVDCILFALDKAACNTVFMRGNDGITHAANDLRSAAIAPFSEAPASRFLPIKAVFTTRKALAALSTNGFDVTNRTVESRIGSVLSAKDVHLYSLSRKFRCYAQVGALCPIVGVVMTLTKGESVTITLKEKRKMLAETGNRFMRSKEKYYRGDWSLSDEIAAVPPRLWASFILEMASEKQLLSWKVAAAAIGKKVVDMFPVLNDFTNIPREEFDNFAQQRFVHKRADETGLRRVDFLLCIRALKVIEQMTYSQSRLRIGPLTMTLSIAGIAESSPSWTSVLHSLGLATSYDAMESFKKSLIAKREQSTRGAFEGVNTTDRLVSIQLDNFDILPFHSMKASGKALPMVSGTATQGIVQSRKRPKLHSAVGINRSTEEPGALVEADTSWRSPSTVLVDRATFSSSFNSVADKNILEDFYDMVFGVVLSRRDDLLGSSASSQFQRRTATLPYKNQGVNFRTLLLSCFSPHGGSDRSAPYLFDQDVLFVDICRMSAADILTIHQKLSLIKDLLQLGEDGSLKYVVVSGDQPTYRMLVKIWRQSFLESKRDTAENSPTNEVKVHEWLIPFPGFFHVEKQSLYPLCKEMLHGLGLTELSGCCGLSKSQVDNILKHSHARNNRAVVFSICAALVIHTVDLIQAERPELKDSVMEIVNRDHSSTKSQSTLFKCTTDLVTGSMIEAGRQLRKGVFDLFANDPNGTHIVHTVLFTCLLPTVGFHVLSRTGHTDVLDSFWLRLNNVLHTSGHLKYQELYLFYSFFRSIMPRIVFEDLYNNKPGALVARVPSFTAGSRSAYDERGWTYVHLDEALEMLIIRLVKGLNQVTLPYLESAGAWLLDVASARLLIRNVTAAARLYRPSRSGDDTGEGIGPLLHYEKSSIQSKSVKAMVELMRAKGFLGHDHRSGDKLCNVLGDHTATLNDAKAQELIMKCDIYGKKTAELHASALFPDVFGKLTKEYYETEFSGKRFRGVWTKARQIPMAGIVMESEKKHTVLKSSKVTKDPKKALSDRRYVLSKVMTTLTLAEHAALSSGDPEGAEHARKQWNVLYSARHMASPFADAYRSFEQGAAGMRHAQKSHILNASNLEGFQEGEDGDDVGIPVRETKAVSFYYDYQFPSYASVMVDVMNHIWTRGTDGRRGNSIFHVTVMKLKHFLRPWFSGSRGKQLRQLHLHVDDPSIVIPQKHGEQARRDATRSMDENTARNGSDELNSIGFLLPITVPWGTITSSRRSRDAVSSVHLFCGAVAAMELAEESSIDVSVFLYGGCFCFKSSCVGKGFEDLLPELALRTDIGSFPRDGEVFIGLKEDLLSIGCSNGEGAPGQAVSSDSSQATTANNGPTVLPSGVSHPDMAGYNPRNELGERRNQTEEDDLLRVPRTAVLMVSNGGGLQISGVCIKHGEAETRFVAAFKHFVSPLLSEESEKDVFKYNDGHHSPLPSHLRCASIVLSKDTDVTMILCLAERMHGRGVLHVLGEHVIEIDTLVRNLSLNGSNQSTLACVYTLAGCDFTPGSYGVRHSHFLSAAVRQRVMLGHLESNSDPTAFELATLLAYLEKKGYRKLLTLAEKDDAMQKWNTESCDAAEIRRRTRTIFASPHVVGSEEWVLDARRHIYDGARSVAELIAPKQHIHLQASRSKFVVFTYWSQAHWDDLSPDVLKGCDESNGFDVSGSVLLEREDDVKILSKQMNELVARCKCKGNCSNRVCSCIKRDRKCIRCECDAGTCRNRATTSGMIYNANAEDADGMEVEEDQEDGSDDEVVTSLQVTELNCDLECNLANDDEETDACSP